MADVTKITLPNGTTKDIKDATARAQANWNTNNSVKNLLDVTYNTYTNNECSYVKNADGSITLTISSTVAAQRQLNLTGKIDNIYDGMIINGSPTGYATGDIAYLITGLKADGTYQNEQFSYNGTETTINRKTPKIMFAIIIKSGVTARTVTLYPMVREVGDSTYEPYALPNTKITPELIELVDSGAKNLVNSTSGSGTRWIDIPVDIPAGEYAASFATLSTTWEVTANQLQISFMDSNYDIVTDDYTYVNYTTKNGVYKLNDTCKNIRLYASPTSVSGKVVTYTNMMICTKAAWDVSQKYVPYRPTYEETVEQVAENGNNISLITPTVKDSGNAFTVGTDYTLVDACTLTVPIPTSGVKCAHILAGLAFNSTAPRGIIISLSNDISDFNASSKLLAKVESSDFIRLTAECFYYNYGGSNVNIYVWAKSSSSGINRVVSSMQLLN